MEVDDVADAHRTMDIHLVAHMDHAHQRQGHARIREQLHAQREREDVEIARVDGVGQRGIDDVGEPRVRVGVDGQAAADAAGGSSESCADPNGRALSRAFA